MNPSTIEKWDSLPFLRVARVSLLRYLKDDGEHGKSLNPKPLWGFL